MAPLGTSGIGKHLCMHAFLEQTAKSVKKKVTLVPVKWSRPRSHFTMLFESWAMRLMAEMPVNAAARELKIY
jgi:hypothetical protein